MTDYSAHDHRYMARALQLARRGLYTTHPNPRVGCVLVRDNAVVSEGWHAVAGEAHAEVQALTAAGLQAEGCTAYVTLEPCAHAGRTGPCADALVEAGIARVVVAMQDPFPEVSGQGLRRLRDAGIAVEVGLMETQARALNPGFLSRIERGRPFLRLKLAVSLDGATMMRNGDSQWITGDAARRDVQDWRARSDAILTGSGTLLADNPRLTVREPRQVLRQPLRVVLDSALCTPVDAACLQEQGETLLFCVDDSRRNELEAAGATVERLASVDGRPVLAVVLDALATRNINEVLVECGPRLSGALLEAQLVDELVIYQSPHIMGSQTRGMAMTPAWASLADRLALRITDRRQVGRDTRIVAVPDRQVPNP